MSVRCAKECKHAVHFPYWAARRQKKGGESDAAEKKEVPLRALIEKENGKRTGAMITMLLLAQSLSYPIKVSKGSKEGRKDHTNCQTKGKGMRQRVVVMVLMI